MKISKFEFVLAWLSSLFEEDRGVGTAVIMLLTTQDGSDNAADNAGRQ
jgi:hypothetical protein